MARPFVDSNGQPLEFSPGEDITFRFLVRESDASDAAVQDITGWTFRLTIARDEYSTEKLLEVVGEIATTDEDGASITPTAGQALATALSEDTIELVPGSFYVDFWRTNDGANRKLADGTIIIKGSARYPVAS